MVVEIFVDARRPEEVPVVEQRIADAVIAFQVTKLAGQPIDVLCC